MAQLKADLAAAKAALTESRAAFMQATKQLANSVPVEALSHAAAPQGTPQAPQSPAAEAAPVTVIPPAPAAAAPQPVPQTAQSTAPAPASAPAAVSAPAIPAPVDPLVAGATVGPNGARVDPVVPN